MWSEIAVGYLKRISKAALWFLLSAGCFLLVFFLADVPVETAAYAALLSLACGLLLAAADFLRYAQNCRALAALKQAGTLSAEALPKTMDSLETAYQELVRGLCRNIRDMEQEYAHSRRDLIDYYTLWVHQIKTPIFAMRLLLQAQECGDTTAMEMELFKIEQYTDMVLQYLRLGSGVNDFVLQEYELDGMVRQALRKYAKMFIGRKISVDFQETRLRVVTDEKWMVFVIEQLLSNALKYTDRGTVSICRGNCKSLVIGDTGIGISGEDLPRIFEKGYTGFNGRMDKKATGLGLYLCRQICGRLSCEISAESKPGSGTRVAITFPEEPA